MLGIVGIIMLLMLIYYKFSPPYHQERAQITIWQKELTEMKIRCDKVILQQELLTKKK